MSEEYILQWLIGTMYATRKNKRYGRDSIQFERQWVPLLCSMARRLSRKTFRIRHNYTFLTSVPKWREIFATEFEGRIADHLLCDTIAPYVEQELHPRTFNNRKGMGSQAAINQVIEDIAEASCGYTQAARVIKWDLQGFFPNANLGVMTGMFCRLIDRHADEIAAQYDIDELPEFLKWLTMVTIHCLPQHHCERRTPRHFWPEHIAPEKSLFSKTDGTGAPIGRMTSQMGMGLYLTDEVAWLNDLCGVRSVLFMDDCVMSVPEGRHHYALSLLPVLRERLAAKGVRMNERKFYDQPYQHGLEFLGTHIRPWALHLNDRTFDRGMKRIADFNADDVETKEAELEQFISTVNSYGGLLKNRTDYRRLLRLRDAIHPDWWQWLEWDYRRQCVVGKPGHDLRGRLNSKYNLRLKNV